MPNLQIELYHKYVGVGKNIGHTGFSTTAGLGTHWGSWNLSPTGLEGLLYSNFRGVISGKQHQE